MVTPSRAEGGRSWTNTNFILLYIQTWIELSFFPEISNVNAKASKQQIWNHIPFQYHSWFGIEHNSIPWPPISTSKRSLNEFISWFLVRSCNYFCNYSTFNPPNTARNGTWKFHLWAYYVCWVKIWPCQSSECTHKVTQTMAISPHHDHRRSLKIAAICRISDDVQKRSCSRI
jgi:hypothetical protein